MPVEPAGEEFVLAVFGAERDCLTGADFAAAMQAVLHQFEIDPTTCGGHRPATTGSRWTRPCSRLSAPSAASDLRCGLATNQQNLRGPTCAGLPASPTSSTTQFYSRELGFAKPDPDYFRAILERIGVPARADPLPRRQA